MPRLVSEPEAPTLGAARSDAPADVKVTSDVEIEDTSVLVGLTGPRGERLKAIGRELSIECGLRGNTIFLQGPAESVGARGAVLRRGGRAAGGRGCRSARTTSRARCGCCGASRT